MLTCRITIPLPPSSCLEEDAAGPLSRRSRRLFDIHQVVPAPNASTIKATTPTDAARMMTLLLLFSSAAGDNALLDEDGINDSALEGGGHCCDEEMPPWAMQAACMALPNIMLIKVGLLANVPSTRVRIVDASNNEEEIFTESFNVKYEIDCTLRCTPPRDIEVVSVMMPVLFSTKSLALQLLPVCITCIAYNT